MSSATMTVEEYVARQPKYTRRRRIMRWLLRTFGFALVKVDASGLENIPDTGRAILMMNHILREGA